MKKTISLFMAILCLVALTLHCFANTANDANKKIVYPIEKIHPHGVLYFHVWGNPELDQSADALLAFAKELCGEECTFYCRPCYMTDAMSYVEVVMKNGCDTPDRDLWALAEKVAANPTVYSVNFSINATVIGDVNGDEQVDALDYLLTKSIALQIYDPAGTDAFARADLDKNGKIDALDYFAIKSMVLNG